MVQEQRQNESSKTLKSVGLRSISKKITLLRSIVHFMSNKRCDVRVLDKDWEKKMNSNGVSISGYFDRSVGASGMYQLKMEKVIYSLSIDLSSILTLKTSQKLNQIFFLAIPQQILGPFNKDGSLLHRGRHTRCDVRISKGKEVKTYSFSFKAQVKSVSEAKE
ncbi:hypothetical protein PIB30_079445 [Stylosanthes scabra]|uniref:Uncharacterized protein n=1 Tax=Stylosanthes scabra TaxID=79078 RepID=A0ABU6YPY6_9FABA|nr:hypothetical protein [Stylosanthes scabra]